MFRTFLLIFFTIVLFKDANAQKSRPIGIVAFYNLENLFDAVDDPEVRDEEFLPEGKNNWTEERYQEKLTNMAKVLGTMTNGPDIIGVCEIENKKVLEDLTATAQLKNKNYAIEHYDSPDKRGIDVALLYRDDKFEVLESKAIEFNHPNKDNYFTRDILWVKGIYFEDTLNIFINHWPSRFGGGMLERKIAAEVLRNEVDIIKEKNPNAKIIIMGDFNDDPIDRSVKKILNTHWNEKKIKDGILYNTSADTFRDGFGTLMYNGAWNLFDQIIISKSLMKSESNNYHYIPNSFKVYAPEWMRVEDGNYKGAPKRTFVSGKYIGGYSDHYPTFIVIGH